MKMVYAAVLACACLALVSGPVYSEEQDYLPPSVDEIIAEEEADGQAPAERTESEPGTFMPAGEEMPQPAEAAEAEAAEVAEVAGDNPDPDDEGAAVEEEYGLVEAGAYGAGLPAVAVLPFQVKGVTVAEQAVAKVAAPTMIDLLVGTGRVDVIERERIEEVVAEIRLGRAGLVNTDTAVKVGELVGASYIVTGDVRTAAKDVHTINAYNVSSSREVYRVALLVRVIDAANGRVVASQKAEKERERILTRFNEVEEGDVFTPLVEDALASIVDEVAYAMAPVGPGAERKMFVFRMDSIPEGADVEIDGVFEGNCPVETELDEGVHHVVVSLPGYYEWDKKVRVRKNVDSPMVARLRPLPETTETRIDLNIDRE